MKRLPALFLAASLPVAIAGGDPCRNCHPAESQSQPGTPMAHALERPDGSAILREHPLLRMTAGRYSYTIRRDGETVRYSVESGGKTFSAAISWAFGLGSAGQTYLYRDGGAWHEARVSFYSAIDGLDITIGHRGLPADTIAEAAGRQLQKSEVERCFGCHGGGTLDEVVPGVQCERCHEKALEHARSFSAHGAAPVVPERLSRYDSEQMADFCGACHRTWQEIAANGPHDINNVRLQPYRLLSSKCYDASLFDARLSCVACHDPHRPVEKSEAFYDGKCLGCHAGRQAGARSCPRADHGCIGCHMPKVELPEAHFTFTDHRIRIVHPGEPYPN